MRSIGEDNQDETLADVVQEFQSLQAIPELTFEEFQNFEEKTEVSPKMLEVSPEVLQQVGSRPLISLEIMTVWPRHCKTYLGFPFNPRY